MILDKYNVRYHEFCATRKSVLLSLLASFVAAFQRDLCIYTGTQIRYFLKMITKLHGVNRKTVYLSATRVSYNSITKELDQLPSRSPLFLQELSSLCFISTVHTFHKNVQLIENNVNSEYLEVGVKNAIAHGDGMEKR